MTSFALRLYAVSTLAMVRLKNVPKSLVVLLLFVLALRYRCFDLDAMTNVDTFSNWIRWSDRFMTGIETGNLTATYQTHHPGLTLMWSVGLLRKAFGVIGTPVDPFTLKLASLPVAIVGSLFAPATYGLVYRLLGPRHHFAALVVGVAIATEPMLMAHSRNAHLDMLVTAFAWTSALSSIIACRSLSKKWVLGSGVLLGLAIASKIAAAGFAIGIVVFFTIETLRNPNQRLARILSLLALGAIAIAVVVLLCPALLSDPLHVLPRFWTGLNREVNIASPVLFLGKVHTDSIPLTIYPVFALFLLTPEIIFPSLVGIVQLTFRRGAARYTLISTFCVTLPFVLLLVTRTHITQRYLLPAVPFLILISALTLECWFFTARKRNLAIAGFLSFALLGLRIHRAEPLLPLPITYCSQWTGIDCANVFHVGWGEGTKEAALQIRKWVVPQNEEKPIAIFGGGYAGTMAAWTPVKRVSKIEDAELLVDYICDWQRLGKASAAVQRYASEKHLLPLFETRLNNRVYVRTYAGPQLKQIRKVPLQFP
jgi:hypothetical protein